MPHARRIALALVCLAATPAGAAAEPAFEPVGAAAARTLSADARHAAFELADGSVRLYDTRTGRVTTHPRPRPDCRFVDVGGGKLLWTCGGWPIHVVVLKIRTGQVKERDVYPGEVGGSVTEVGTYWLKGTGSDHRGGQHTTWWSLADNRLVVDRGDGAARYVDDLDLPRLTRRMCSPLRKQPNPDYDLDWDYAEYLPYQYDGGFGLYFDQGRWTLDRCGRGSYALLPAGAGAARLTAGRVTWTKGRQVAAYDAPRRRSLRWGLAQIDPAATRARVAHTRHAIFVATASGDADQLERVYAAPFPD